MHIWHIFLKLRYQKRVLIKLVLYSKFYKMRFFLFIILIMILSSCQENQSANASTISKNTVETLAPNTPAIAEATSTDNSEIHKAKASNKSDVEKAPKVEVKKITAEMQQADINKIIENATATKPIATPKGTPKPPVKKAPEQVIKEQPEVVIKKQEEKPIVIEKTQPTITTKPAPQKATKISHTSFDNYLKKYVSASGNVNYGGMKTDYQPLKTYLKELAKSTPKSDWSRNEKLAYWINAYNAFTIDLILSNYPVSKITDLDGGSPWKVNRIELEGKKYSLDQIENKIIRPQFKEPRIHFAVNCAAKSCPTLMNGAFLPSKLDNQLEKQTKKFINNPSFNTISEGGAKVSKIFEWYGEDFGNLIEYLNKYSTQKISPNSKVEFEEYNWALNGK